MSDTTVWELAAATNQPLEVVIFQAVAYKAWNPGGTIDSEWAAVLTGVLGGSHPWQRTTTHAPDVADTDTAHQPDVAGTATDPAAFAAAVLAQLGQRTTITDPAMAERLVAAGLGDIDAAGFVGYPEEAPTWAQLANGTMSIDDLDNV